MSGEFRIKAQQDSTFPNHGVFEKFGGKKKLATEVISYCRTHGGLDEVLKICTGHAYNDELTSTENIETENKMNDGFVYLMNANSG